MKQKQIFMDFKNLFSTFKVKTFNQRQDLVIGRIMDLSYFRLLLESRLRKDLESFARKYGQFESTVNDDI